MSRPGRPAPAAPVERPGAVEWLTLLLICASSVLCGLFELLFVGRFYAGTVIVPVVIVFAIATNIVLPAWGFRVLGRVQGAVLPLLAWLLVVLALTLYARPEGDLIVIDAFGQQWGFYGVLLLGTGAGFGVIVVLAGRLSPAARSIAKPPVAQTPNAPTPNAPTRNAPPRNAPPRNSPTGKAPTRNTSGASARSPSPKGAKRKSTDNSPRKKGGDGLSR